MEKEARPDEQGSLSKDGLFVGRYILWEAPKAIFALQAQEARGREERSAGEMSSPHLGLEEAA